MKKAKKLYLCIEHAEWVDDEGKKQTAIEKYVGTINPLSKDKYFEGAWFDENNNLQGSRVFSKEEFKTEIFSCKELEIE